MLLLDGQKNKRNRIRAINMLSGPHFLSPLCFKGLFRDAERASAAAFQVFRRALGEDEDFADAMVPFENNIRLAKDAADQSARKQKLKHPLDSSGKKRNDSSTRISAAAAAATAAAAAASTEALATETATMVNQDNHAEGCGGGRGGRASSPISKGDRFATSSADDNNSTTGNNRCKGTGKKLGRGKPARGSSRRTGRGGRGGGRASARTATRSTGAAAKPHPTDAAATTQPNAYIEDHVGLEAAIKLSAELSAAEAANRGDGEGDGDSDGGGDGDGDGDGDDDDDALAEALRRSMLSLAEETHLKDC